MKRPLRLTIAILWLVLFTLSVHGEDFNYVTNNGTITITGYIGSGGDVTIPSTINSLPVTDIGGSAFYYCNSLNSITIPGSVSSIGDGAFAECRSLTNVTINSGVTYLGFGTFGGCTNLTSIAIPDSVTSIGEAGLSHWGGAFSRCTSLTAIMVDPANSFYSSVDGVLFNKSQSRLIEYPEGKTGNYTIPNSVATVAQWAFDCCTKLTSVTIPNKVTSIGAYAFDGCTSLTSVTIPNSVTRIWVGAFAGCFSLTAITVDTLNPAYSSVDGVLFNKSQTTLIVFPGGKAGDYIVPNNVTNIGNEAFYFCASLEGVYFQGNTPNVGGYVFDDQNSKATVYYVPGTTGWTSTFGGRPTAPWVLRYPVILTTAPNFGIQNNAFGFRISWATNASVVVEVPTTLANPIWSPVSTNLLVNGWSDFRDAEWRNYPARFYRIRPQ